MTGYATDETDYSDFFTQKYDTDGTPLWSGTFAGTWEDDDYAYAIAVDGAGNVCISGQTSNSGTGSDISTIMYDATGTQLWAQTWAGAGNTLEESVDIGVDSQGNVYVAGNSKNTTDNTWDIITIKYDVGGNEQWVAVYDGAAGADDNCSEMVVDDAGNVFLVGSTDNEDGNQDWVTIKYDATGALQWAVQRASSDGSN